MAPYLRGTVAIAANYDDNSIQTIPQADNIVAVNYGSGNVTFTQPVLLRANVAGNAVIVPWARRADSVPASVTVALAVGEILPVLVWRLVASGSTATMHALYVGDAANPGA